MATEITKKIAGSYYPTNYHLTPLAT